MLYGCFAGIKKCDPKAGFHYIFISEISRKREVDAIFKALMCSQSDCAFPWESVSGLCWYYFFCNVPILLIAQLRSPFWWIATRKRLDARLPTAVHERAAEIEPKAFIDCLKLHPGRQTRGPYFSPGQDDSSNLLEGNNLQNKVKINLGKNYKLLVDIGKFTWELPAI